MVTVGANVVFGVGCKAAGVAAFFGSEAIVVGAGVREDFPCTCWAGKGVEGCKAWGAFDALG